MTRRLMTLPVFVVLIMAGAGAGVGETPNSPIVTIDWTSTAPLSGTVIGGRLVLDETSGGSFPVAVIDAPPLTGGDILMKVDVAVDAAATPGYLELWVVLEDGGRFFSRSLDVAGGGILRAGETLTVDLPFTLEGTVPEILELNAILPNGGRLEIGSVELYEFTSDDDSWWSQDTGGLIGGLTGGLFGLLGALVGSLTSRAKARRFVAATVIASISIAALAIGFAIVAIVIGQPYQVWFPLLLGGTILGGVFGGLRRQITARYESAELQKIRALDLV